MLLTPDQVPLDELDYSMLNAPTKVIVRQLLFGLACQTLALIWGKFSGNINLIASPLQLDYGQLMTLGREEREKAETNLKERLQRMNPYETMKRQAELVQSMLDIKKAKPLGIIVI